MFDFGLGVSEIMVIAVVALIVVGPKDLPRLLRMVGKFVTQLRGMAGEFQRHLDAAVRDAGLEEVKKEVRNMTNFTVTNDIAKQPEIESKKPDDSLKLPPEQAAPLPPEAPEKSASSSAEESKKAEVS